jgi:DNA-binding SARP family transcriptional activator
MPDDAVPDRPASRPGSEGRHRLKLRLLGGFQLEQGGRTLRVPHSGRRIVAFLGIRGRSDRAEIAGSLWPEVPEPKALANLRTALWRLRRLTAFEVVSGQEVLATADTVDVDVQAFVAAISRITDGAADRAAIPVLPTFGELLPGWYEDWVLFERERLRQLQMHALELVAGRLTSAGRFGEAVDAALAAVRLEPLRESATRALIAAHLGENNIIEAVRCFESFRHHLATELGVQPTRELERLMQSFLTPQA